MPVTEGFRVATAYVALTIEEGDIQALIERSVTEACQRAGADGGSALTEEIASAVDGAAPDLSGPLADSLAGAGDTAAAEIATALTDRIGGAGDAGGVELAAALEAATADVGADIADRVGGQLEADLPEEASAVASQMAAEFTAGLADVGDTIASQIGQQLSAGLDEAAQAGAGALMQLSVTGSAGVAGVMAAAGAGTGIMGALTASVADAAAEAGGIAGTELARNLSEAAVMALSDEAFAAFTDQLVATASEAGDAAGVAAADAMGAGFSDASSGLDLIAAGLSTVGQSMTTGARALAVDAEETMARVEQATLSGAQAYEAELDAVFEAIYRQGDGLPVHLAAAMVEAFQGIEADTAGFTSTELRLFTEFFQTLETQGDEAALSLASRMNIINSSLLGQDLMGQGLTSVGAPMPAAGAAAEGAASGLMAVRPAASAVEGELGAVDKAAAAASGSIGGMAGMLGGPWLFGIMGAISILPMFSSLLGGNSQAAQQAALMHQQLAQAISQDSGGFGDSTAAMIENTLAQSNLMGLSNDLGVSQAQLIEYAAGEADAQSKVSSAYDATSASLSAAAGMTGEYYRADTAAGDAAQATLNRINDQKAALDKITASVRDAILANREQTETLLAAESSTEIYTAAVADLVSKQKLQAEQSKMQADATTSYLMTVVPGTQAYTDAIDAQIAALDQNNVSAQESAQAFNDLLPLQGQLSDAALKASSDYRDAGNEASAYKTALDGLLGENENVGDAQAQLTLKLDGLNGKLTAGRDAMNNLTDAGAKNEQQLKPVADAVKNLADQLYQQTGDAGKADDSLRSNAARMDAAAKQAHLTTDQIKALNIEFFGTPDVKTITIQADQTPAHTQMKALDTFVKGEIDDINAHPIQPKVNAAQIQGEVASMVGNIDTILGNAFGFSLPHHATGGPVRAGAPVIVGDGGRPEVFVPNSDGRIYPSVGDGVRALAGQGGGQSINFNYYGTQHPTPEQRQVMMRDLTVAATRGGING